MLSKIAKPRYYDVKFWSLLLLFRFDTYYETLN